MINGLLAILISFADQFANFAKQELIAGVNPKIYVGYFFVLFFISTECIVLYNVRKETPWAFLFYSSLSFVTAWVLTVIIVDMVRKLI